MKKRLSSTLAKAREARDAKRRRITGVVQPEAAVYRIAEEVVQPEAAGPCVGEEAAQPEASGSRRTEEVARAGTLGSSSHLAAAQLPLNEMPLPDTQQQVGILPSNYLQAS